MQFVVIGLDGTDNDAPARRKAVREDHISHWAINYLLAVIYGMVSRC